MGRTPAQHAESKCTNLVLVELNELGLGLGHGVLVSGDDDRVALGICAGELHVDAVAIAKRVDVLPHHPATTHRPSGGCQIQRTCPSLLSPARHVASETSEPSNAAATYLALRTDQRAVELAVDAELHTDRRTRLGLSSDARKTDRQFERSASSKHSASTAPRVPS